MTSQKSEHEASEKATNRMPSDSTFYDKVVPAILIIMGLIMLGLILFALGVLLGLIPFVGL